MSSPTEILRRYGLRPQKKWGQSFLHDRHVVERICNLARLTDRHVVIEIGAGLGILTSELVRRVRRVIAIERDPALIPVLREELADKGDVEIIHADALEFDFDTFRETERENLAVVGNLPYNISTPLIFRLLAQNTMISSVTIMLQREVAERLCAVPNTKTYGAPTVMCAQYADMEYGFHVGPGAFIPPPRVDSAVIRMALRQEPREPANGKIFHDVVHAAFAQRRKMLTGALRATYGKDVVQSALSEASIDGQRRGETLNVAEFARLARAIEMLI